ncbi:unnamed protein product [Vitrella brassicaformis CCMP3155]|uniref:Ferroxidase n=2 Tax=Vitrella brassicaformis TaxID=1169539 RepID=A0A0G4F081_VITBC|nr:unnamed protein product [Vitrella brassicaformis CCMP3155]|mmetsp:Transcript_38373/g.109656  ORF Transcript_38373/g.109656 Transcript_38373/m.109656 type:complete len:179 (+) Transcript_38373:55-591(+)|eukprot:CEM04614.1 unnamed protein product [Vitrella brassicaformis CCMP3155]
MLRRCEICMRKLPFLGAAKESISITGLAHRQHLRLPEDSRRPRQRLGSRAFASAADDAAEEGGSEEFFYHKYADKALQCIHDKIEAAQLDSVEELDLQEGVLNIDLGEHGTFVINKHFVTRQIWYSSPISGAHYFEFASEPRWKSTRHGNDLFGFLSGELQQASGETADLLPCRDKVK